MNLKQITCAANVFVVIYQANLHDSKKILLIQYYVSIEIFKNSLVKADVEREKQWEKRVEYRGVLQCKFIVNKFRAVL